MAAWHHAGFLSIYAFIQLLEIHQAKQLQLLSHKHESVLRTQTLKTVCRAIRVLTLEAHFRPRQTNPSLQCRAHVRHVTGQAHAHGRHATSNVDMSLVIHAVERICEHV